MITLTIGRPRYKLGARTFENDVVTNFLKQSNFTENLTFGINLINVLAANSSIEMQINKS